MPDTLPTSNHETRTLAGGALTNMIGEIVRSMRPIYLVILSRLFGAEMIGLYFQGYAVFDMLSHLALFGMDKMLLRFIPLTRNAGDSAGETRVLRTALWTGAAVSMLLATVLFLAAPWVVARWYEEPALASVLRLVALSLPCYVISQILLHYIRALKQMREFYYVRGIAEPLVFIVVSLVCYWIGARVNGVVLGHTVAAAAGLLFSILLLMKVRRRLLLTGTPVESIRITHQSMLNFGLPVCVTEFFNTALGRFDIILLGILAPGSSALWGIYGAAVEIASVVRKLRMPFDPIFGPVAAELEGRGDRRELRNQWVVTTRWIIMVTLPCFVLFFLLPDAVMALYGNAFTAGASVLMLLAAGRLANTLIGPGQMVLLVTNHAWLDLFNQTIAIALQVTLLYVLIPSMGILGAAIATASGLWLLNTLRLGETLRLLHMHPYAPSLFKPLAAFLCSGLVLMGFRMLYQTPDLIQFTLGIVLVLAVSGSVYWMAGFDPVDKDTFKNLWRKRVPPVSSEE